MSQRAKVLWVIALAILPLVALSGFTIWQQYLRDEGMVSAERTYFAQATALAAEHFLDGQVAAARGSDAADKPSVGPAKIVDGKPTVLITAAGGRVVPVPTERFAQGLMQKISSPLLDLTVIDSEGQAFIRGDQEVKDLVKLDGPHVNAALGGKSGAAIAPFGERSSLIAYAPVGTYGWIVLLTEPTVSAFASARRQVLERGAVLAVILAVVGALGWTLAGRLSTAYQSAVQARAEAERLSRDLKRAVHARDEFLAAASHDLRNPLSTIQAAAELLERSTEQGGLTKERIATCSEHILSASRRMAALLDAFLDVSRLEAGKPLELNKQRCDLVPRVRQV